MGGLEFIPLKDLPISKSKAYQLAKSDGLRIIRLGRNVGVLNVDWVKFLNSLASFTPSGESSKRHAAAAKARWQKAKREKAE